MSALISAPRAGVCAVRTVYKYCIERVGCVQFPIDSNLNSARLAPVPLFWDRSVLLRACVLYCTTAPVHGTPVITLRPCWVAPMFQGEGSTSQANACLNKVAGMVSKVRTQCIHMIHTASSSLHVHV